MTTSKPTRRAHAPTSCNWCTQLSMSGHDDEGDHWCRMEARDETIKATRIQERGRSRYFLDGIKRPFLTESNLLDAVEADYLTPVQGEVLYRLVDDGPDPDDAEAEGGG